MMLAMLVQTIYNLADGIWVAGLGPQALAAIGLFFPIFMIIISLAAGIGVGASSVVSQKIGERDKTGADVAASVSMLLSVIIGLMGIAVFLPAVPSILGFAGARGETLNLTLEYSVVLIYSMPLLMFNNVANGVLRGEGDAKRAMIAIAAGSLLNIALDPLFIYVFGFGIKGAAYATVLSIAVSSFLISFWLFFKKDTYVSFHLGWNWEILKRILKIGIPASLAQAMMSIAIYILNVFAVKAGGDYGVAVFTSAWRVVNFGTVPLIGMAMAVTSVTGAAFGERNAEKLETAHLYAVKLGFFIGLVVMLAILVFAPFIAKAFTYSQEGERIYSELVRALRVLSLFLPGVPFGMFTSSMFQGVGQGLKSLAVTIMRTVIMQVLFSWLFVFVLKAGLMGVWWGIVLGNATSAFITFTWGRFTVNRLKKEFQAL
ncbi:MULTISPECIES: MATE family efflux transporter [Thermotoga]|uniref:MATE efflux family protein n=1 Tax=Thermotoga neapolitana (strain ATCC 49049 / DSM 4359 / NBRC 107923 / NS-E) TaxID=309803 RepID=B9K7Y1_THENN|nr:MULTISPECIES: MATE family efflux transporter [Thermotoga]ACM23064.1 MATE efflux family protein [Thermotoga neapolitana DSM 4359]KFZ21876.1 MATE efflux family protein [Thermotoga neapolitana LA10]